MDNKENFVHSLTKEISLGNKKKTIFNWTFFFVFFGPMVATAILFIVMISGVDQPTPWFNWVMFVVFLPMITTSLVLTQKKELVGAYGETILILIPTFVWLLPSHTQSMKVLLTISIVLVAIGLAMYTIGIFRKTDFGHANKEKREKITNVIIRVAFVASSVVSTVTISIIMIFWGDYSLKLPVDELGDRDYTRTAWILFISIVTILVALLLIILGLVSNHNYELFKNKNKIQSHNNKKSFVSIFKLAISPNKNIYKYKKKRWWQKKHFKDKDQSVL